MKPLNWGMEDPTTLARVFQRLVLHLRTHNWLIYRSLLTAGLLPCSTHLGCKQCQLNYWPCSCWQGIFPPVISFTFEEDISWIWCLFAWCERAQCFLLLCWVAICLIREVPALQDPTDQTGLDNYMVHQLDGTQNEWGWCKQKVS